MTIDSLPYPAPEPACCLPCCTHVTCLHSPPASPPLLHPLGALPISCRRLLSRCIWQKIKWRLPHSKPPPAGVAPGGGSAPTGAGSSPVGCLLRGWHMPPHRCLSLPAFPNAGTAHAAAARRRLQRLHVHPLPPGSPPICLLLLPADRHRFITRLSRYPSLLHAFIHSIAHSLTRSFTDPPVAPDR